MHNVVAVFFQGSNSRDEIVQRGVGCGSRRNKALIMTKTKEVIDKAYCLQPFQITGMKQVSHFQPTKIVMVPNSARIIIRSPEYYELNLTIFIFVPQNCFRLTIERSAHRLERSRKVSVTDYNHYAFL